MKTLLFLLLTVALPVFAQMPDAYASPAPKSADMLAAEKLAQDFIEAAFSKDYRNAEKMMDPESPQKGETGSAEFRKQRIALIQQIVESRDKQGETRRWDKIISDKFRQRTGRPPTEEFADFTFWATYPDGSKSSNRVSVVKKNGAMYIEL